MSFLRTVHISMDLVFKVDFLWAGFGFANMLWGYNTLLPDSPRKDIKCVVIFSLSQRWVEPRGRGERKWAKDCGSKGNLLGPIQSSSKDTLFQTEQTFRGRLCKAPAFQHPWKPATPIHSELRIKKTRGMKASIYPWSMSRIVLLGWISGFFWWCEDLFYIFLEGLGPHHQTFLYLFFQWGCLIV